MKAAVYLRQSVDKRDDQLAISRQREDCLKLCKQRGWTPVEYVDNDTSASSGKRRPRYKALLADIENGSVQAVVAWHLDRLHRQPIELEHFISLADVKHVALATVTGDVDLSTDQGRLVARIMGAVARGEIERKSERQQRASLQIAESGRPNATPRAFGYTKNWTDTVESEAAALRDAYTMMLSGGSLNSIVRHWNNIGVTTSLGNAWNSKTVRQALLNPRYAALRAYKGEILEGVKATWPEIVSEDVWRSVAGILTDPNRQPGRLPRRHLLSGLALCGVCRAPIGAGVKRRGDGSVYTCRECFKVSRATDLIDPVVVGLALAFLASPDATDVLIDRKRNDLVELRQQERAVLERLDALGVDYAEGNLNGREVKIARERLESKLTKARDKMRDANKSKAFEGLVGAEDVESVWHGLSLERRRAVLSALFEITIKPVGSGRRDFDPEHHIGIRWLTSEE